MTLELEDWCFQVDPEATREHTTQNSMDHCDCAYCQNYYEAAAMVYPELIPFLDAFGVNFQGPSELMPFSPTCILAAYRVKGRILRFGTSQLLAGNVTIVPEAAEDDSFLLWAGEMSLPWLQSVPQDEVISPANLPEFLERMEQVWLLRHGSDQIPS